MRGTVRAGSIAAIALLAAGIAAAQSPGMTFFVTSSGPGKGADLGGIEGADKHCQALAAAVGAGGKKWRAYLSTQAASGTPAVNAKDRIGKGPWQNAKGVVVAKDVAELHGSNNLTKQTALNEKGAVVNGRGDTPNTHDILTGTQMDGTAYTGADDMTCGSWTKSGDGVAMVGHHDRVGNDPPPLGPSWNSSHKTVGCSAEALPKTGGAGLFYCFASD